MKTDCKSSHSRLPAQRRALDPDNTVANFQKDVSLHHIGRPQMQQGPPAREKQADAGLDGPSV